MLGDADLSEVFKASHAASVKLQIEVNPKLVSHTWWETTDGSGFRKEIARRPIVEIEVRGAKQSTETDSGTHRRRSA